MIYLIQGPDAVSSRSFLLKIKEKYQATTEIDGKKASRSLALKDKQYLLTKSHLIVIDNFVPKEKLEVPEQVDVVIWTEESLDAPSWVDKNFFFKQTETANTFRLADAVLYGQEKLALQLLEKLIAQGISPEMVVGSLVHSIRQLSFALEGNYEKVSKSTFVQKKIKEQIRGWDRPTLRTASTLLLKADWEIKTARLTSEIALTTLIHNLCRLARN